MPLWLGLTGGRRISGRAGKAEDKRVASQDARDRLSDVRSLAPARETGTLRRSLMNHSSRLNQWLARNFGFFARLWQRSMNDKLAAEACQELDTARMNLVVAADLWLSYRDDTDLVGAVCRYRNALTRYIGLTKGPEAVEVAMKTWELCEWSAKESAKEKAEASEEKARRERQDAVIDAAADPRNFPGIERED